MQRRVVARCAPVHGELLTACARAYRQRCAVVARAFANCVVKAAGQHVRSEVEHNAAPPRSKSLGARAAQRVCKLRRVGHAARAHRPRRHMQSKPRARSPRRASDRARAST